VALAAFASASSAAFVLALSGLTALTALTSLSTTATATTTALLLCGLRRDGILAFLQEAADDLTGAARGGFVRERVF